MAIDASGYIQGGSSTTSVAGSSEDQRDELGYWTLGRCKRAYQDYLGNKRDEIEEQKGARRYRHCAHWTDDQIKVLNRRKQPVVTYNRIGRKVDGIVGLVEKLRQDPKAYPRTPQHQQGADLATAVLRYVLDAADWKAKSPLVSEDGAVDGLGGVELELVPGDKFNLSTGQADLEVSFNVVDPENYFYDPRSFQFDFSDARYLGMGKWMDIEVVQELFPDADISSTGNMGLELTTNSDRDNKWFFTSGNRQMVRVVDIWYKRQGRWLYTVFTGSQKLDEGPSPYIDEKGRSYCKYVMWSAAVDHDGDRYGFVRNLKSPQDEINMRRSKGLHELNSRRIKAPIGAFDDIEKTRAEAARADGIILYNPAAGGNQVDFDDQAKQINLQGQLQFLQEAKNEIENFGPNPAILGQGISNQSGRAIALMQQAGIAELGPYILAYRGWKIRLYRALWNAVQQFWTAERWIRVTDSAGLAQFVQINGMAVDPMTGMPTIVNAVGTLDVDIILDEGPDTVNLQQDTYDFMSNVLPNVAPLLSPQLAAAALDTIIQVSPLPADVKQRFAAAAQAPQPPSPDQQKIELQKQELALDAQTKQAELALKAQQNAASTTARQNDAILDAQLKAAEHTASLARQREQHLQNQQMAREVAQQELELERAKTAHAMHVAEHATAHKTALELEAIKSKANAKGPKLPKQILPSPNDGKIAQALTELAAVVRQANRPKRIRKGKDGYQIELLP